jgi:Tol biopolymer transport system component
MAVLLLPGLGGTATARFTGTIAFVANIDNKPDVYVIAPNGRRRRRLTHDTREESSPTWAPNGRSLAFVATRFGVGKSHQNAIATISAVTARGSKRRALFRATGIQLPFYDLGWSPDGRRIAFTWFRDERYQLWLVRVARRTIASVTTNAIQLSWAPDGRRMVYSTIRRGDRLRRLASLDPRSRYWGVNFVPSLCLISGEFELVLRYGSSGS